jgi:hypothetical protein
VEPRWGGEHSDGQRRVKMQMKIEDGTLEVVTSRSQIAEMIGICILATASILLAGTVLGVVMTIAVVGAAVLIHSATRYA